MAGLAPDAGEVLAFKNFLNHTAPQDQLLKLFVNDYTPVEGSVDSDFTEMSTQGYADIALAGASWVVTPGSPTSAAYAQQTWTFDGTGGPTVVYGYYVVQAVSGIIMVAERFGTPPTIVNNGDQIKVTPNFTLTSP